MRRRKVKADVSKAAVVLTNPTHYAVALGFDFATMEAPKVLAKGRNLLAEEIKAEARWAGVPIRREPAAGALALSLGRSRPGDSGRSLRRGGGDSRLPLPAARGGRDARAARARSRAGPGSRPKASPATMRGRDSRSPVRNAAHREASDEHHRDSAEPRDRFPPISILAAAAGIRAAAGRHQRDLCHAGAAAGCGAGSSAGACRWPPRSSSFCPRCRFAARSSCRVFPTLLLLLTLFRLSLNIASSRRILLHGSEGTAAAGKVIEAFGQFVVGGNYVVGFVLFLALIAIQFLVVSHGAVRTAEVTARFTLDALPGKQMAIDADMNAGLIDEAEARRRRQAIAREAEFYGAMDGAARFNQRDSLATILITAINIIAGLLIGTLQQGIDLGEAVRTYTDPHRRRRAGDDDPVAAGLGGRRHHADPRQLGRHAGRRDLASSCWRGPQRSIWPAWSRGAMCLIPGSAEAGVSAGCCGSLLGWRAVSAASPPAIIRGRAGRGGEEEGRARAGVGAGGAAAPGRPDPRDRISADSAGGREAGRAAAEPGAFAAPPSLRGDGLSGSAGAYLGQPAPQAARVSVLAARAWRLAAGRPRVRNCWPSRAIRARRPLAGKETREPAFGVPAVWIAPALEEQAIAAGYSVVDAVTVITTHLGELIRQHAWELLGRAETKRLLDSLNESHPKLIEELVPKLLTLGEVGRVLEQLLRERVSIRDLGTILEALLETAPLNKSLVALVEAARQALGRRLVQPLLDGDGQLPVLLLDPALEEEILATLSPETGQRLLTAAAAHGVRRCVRRLTDSVRHLIGAASASALPVLLCPSPARYHVKRWLEPILPRLAVVAAGEIPPEIRLRPVGTVR